MKVSKESIIKYLNKGGYPTLVDMKLDEVEDTVWFIFSDGPPMDEGEFHLGDAAQAATVFALLNKFGE